MTTKQKRKSGKFGCLKTFKVIPKLSLEDMDLLSVTWRTDRFGYPMRKTECKIKGKKLTTRTYLHRYVMSRMKLSFLSSHECVDHINGDVLDARRENLRLVTHAQNTQNRTSHQFRGTYRNGTKWQATVKYMGRSYYLGCYASREVAAEVAANKRLALGFLTGAPIIHLIETDNDTNMVKTKAATTSTPRP